MPRRRRRTAGEEQAARLHQSAQDRGARYAQARPTDRREPLPAGSDLGELGTAHDEVDLTFGYFGEVIRVNPSLSELDQIEFIDRATSIDEDDPRSMLFVKDYLQGLVHDDDFDTMWMLARRHRQSVEDLMKLSKSVFEAVVGRPTGQPSGSSAGQSSTAGSSTDASSSRVMRRLEGRPDLQLAVVQAQQARAAG